MIEEILSASSIPGSESRFPDPPPVTYAVWFDDVSTDGPDGINRIFTHNGTIELYEPAKDDAAETTLEAELNARKLRWTKQARYWLSSVQRYQVIYEFSYIVKQ